MERSIKLKTDSILQVPLQNYQNDFTFIVNSERFETSSIVADLLSPIISKQRLNDPTIHEFSLKTKTRGDFRVILDLISFKDTTISENNISFIIEVLTQLGTESIEVSLPSDSEEEITKDNVFEHIKSHQKYPIFYKNELQRELDFISENFSDMKEKLIKFASEENENENEADDESEDCSLIETIIFNDKLRLENEDELLETINNLYTINTKYSILYQYVDFVNVEVSSINSFVSIFDFNDLTLKTWNSVVERLQQKIENKSDKTSKHQLKKKPGLEFESKEGKFEGIFRYLKEKGDIKNEVSITSSSNGGYDHYNMLDLDKIDSFFQTQDKQNSWICFEFKNHQVIPTGYIIRTYPSEDNYHLKSWVVEGSNDNNNWTKIDEHKNDSSLKGKSRVHLFNITNNRNNQSFKYLRIYQTGPNWLNNNDQDHHLLISSIEFYGRLI